MPVPDPGFIFLVLFIWLAFIVSRRMAPPNLVHNIRYRRLAKAWMLNQHQISKWMYNHRDLFNGDINKALSHPSVKPLLRKSDRIYSRMVAINPDLQRVIKI